MGQRPHEVSEALGRLVKRESTLSIPPRKSDDDCILYDYIDSLEGKLERAEGRKVDGATSDGYHTFSELYEHRTLLFLCIAIAHGDRAGWRPHYDGWPLVFINTEEGQISYHIPERFVPLIEGRVPRRDDYVWDGHTSNDVVERLKKLIDRGNSYVR